MNTSTMLSDDPIFSILGQKKPVKVIDPSIYTESFIKAVATKVVKGKPLNEDELTYLSIDPSKCKNEWVEFVRDRFQGHNIPKNAAQEIYSTGIDNGNGRNGLAYTLKSKINDHIKNSSVFFDELVGKYLYDFSVVPYIDKNWNLKHTSSNTANHYHNNGKLHNSLIARNQSVFTENPSHFKEHSPGNNKSFVKPTGEAFGIEIEMSFKPNTGDQYIGAANKLNFANWVHDNYPNWICERDGSLEEGNKGNAGLCGLELVSPPLTFDEAITNLPIILDKARSLGAKAFIPNNEFFGIHVTTNLYGKTATKTGDKIVYLVNNKIFREFWYACAKRNGLAINKFAPFMNDLSLGSALKSQSGGEHYRSVNPRGSGALEIRIFRSTVAFPGIHAILELVKITQDYCMNVTNNSSLDSPREFMDYIKGNMSKNLESWLTGNGALQILEILSNLNVSNINNSTFEA
jgi:hypothetical protein